MKSILELPNDVLGSVFLLLKKSELESCSLVCKQWSNVINWERLCKQRWKRSLDYEVEQYQGSWKKMRLDCNRKSFGTMILYRINEIDL